jgi:hypothetical protein
MPDPFVSDSLVAVIIPALNEAGKIGRVFEWIPRDGRFEAIVVDDGSTDGKAEGSRSPAGPQRGRVADAVTAGGGRGDEGQELVPDVRPARRSPEAKVRVDESLQAEVLGEVAGRRSSASATRRSSSEDVSSRSMLCDDRVDQVLLCVGRWADLNAIFQFRRAPDSSFQRFSAADRRWIRANARSGGAGAGQGCRP